MAEVVSFSFEEKFPLHSVTIDGNPWFFSADIAAVLELSNVRSSVALLDDDEKAVYAVETSSGVQDVSIVSESGFYALCFKSRKPAAKRFRKWVTSEVLPAIRKTGRYECPAHPQYLTDQQCWAIQSAVGKRAKGVGAHFQTIYRALKARFQVPTYTRILSKDFDEAIAFIETCELRTPVQKEPAPQLPKQDDACPHCGLHPIPSDAIVLSAEEARSLLTFVYYVRYLFADTYQAMYKMLRLVNSPMAPNFYDAFYEVNWNRMLSILARHGHDIRDLKCYQHFISHQA